jgi:hypothetical protein
MNSGQARAYCENVLKNEMGIPREGAGWAVGERREGGDAIMKDQSRPAQATDPLEGVSAK